MTDHFTTKPVGEGSGMGLSVVHGIVEDCGGNVDIVSVEGEGTTVHVFLPEYVRTKEEKKETPMSQNRKRKTVF